MKYAWIQQQRDQYPLRTMCLVLEVSRSGYYAWVKRGASSRSEDREKFRDKVQEVYDSSRGVYGYRKVHQELQAQGIACCRETVRKAMRSRELFSRVKRAFVVTTDSGHDYEVAENVLDRDFEARGPNEKWGCDITSIPTREGWLYLAVVIDFFSRRVVGWSTSRSLETPLVICALQMAIEQRRPGAGLIHHSDRGSQYASDAYGDLLAAERFIRSMSRKGNCWDNAPVESFFGKLKTEWLSEGPYASRAEARRALFEYIEVFYNRERRHAALGYVSPSEYERMYTDTPASDVA